MQLQFQQQIQELQQQQQRHFVHQQQQWTNLQVYQQWQIQQRQWLPPLLAAPFFQQQQQPFLAPPFHQRQQAMNPDAPVFDRGQLHHSGCNTDLEVESSPVETSL